MHWLFNHNLVIRELQPMMKWARTNTTSHSIEASSYILKPTHVHMMSTTRWTGEGVNFAWYLWRWSWPVLVARVSRWDRRPFLNIYCEIILEQIFSWGEETPEVSPVLIISWSLNWICRLRWRYFQALRFLSAVDFWCPFICQATFSADQHGTRYTWRVGQWGGEGRKGAGNNWLSKWIDGAYLQPWHSSKLLHTQLPPLSTSVHFTVLAAISNWLLEQQTELDFIVFLCKWALVIRYSLDGLGIWLNIQTTTHVKTNTSLK